MGKFNFLRTNSITFDFISGLPENQYTMVRNIWNNDYVVYGDTTNPVNIPSSTQYLPFDVTEAYLRLTTTGHGQGNTDNADSKTHMAQHHSPVTWRKLAKFR